MKIKAKQARRQRKKIASERLAWEALRNRAIDMGDDVGHFNAIIRDKQESEANLAVIEAEAQS